MSHRTIKVTLTGPDPYGEFTVESDFPKVIARSQHPDEATHFVKGAVLHVLADWKHVPDTITFEPVDRTEKNP